MPEESVKLDGGVALVTGAARRIGAAIARELHAAGMRVALHYRGSRAEAEALHDELQRDRAGSACLLRADLNEAGAASELVDRAASEWSRLDLLVNNASSFYPTPLGSVTAAQWDDLLGANLRAPFFLAQAAATHLAAHGGSIVNLADIHAERPLAGHAVYSIAKAGVVMLTRALARELAPVRVNAVAPGAILWPEPEPAAQARQRVLDGIPLGRLGTPEDIAQAVRFLARARYVTGQVLAVDGGRSAVG